MSAMRSRRLLLPVVLLAAPATAAPVISEVLYGTSANEYVEIYNPGPGPICDLTAFVLIEGTTPRALPAGALPAGGVLILEDTTDAATATSLVPPAAESFVLSLNNAGEALGLCAAGAATVADASCDVANPGTGDWFAGSDADVAMERTSETAPGGEAASWTSFAGSPSAVTNSAGAGIMGSPGVVPFELDPAADTTLDDCAVADAGAPPVDGGAPPADAGGPAAYAGLAITEIFFNAAGTATDVGKEWIEVANLSDAPVALDDVVVERLVGATSPTVDSSVPIDGSGVVLDPGERAVIAQQADLGAAVCVDVPVVVLDSASTAFSLPQSGGTYWVRVKGPGFTNDVRYVYSNPSPTTFDGRSMALLDETRDNSSVANFAPSTCTFTGTVGGSPGVDNADCAGATYTCGVTTDGGVIVDEDGGVIVVPPVDAGPNDPPVVVVTQPTALVDGSPVRVVYTATDPDDGDVVEVELYADADGQGNDGVRVARGLPGGVDVEHLWRPADLPAGTYRVFARAVDRRGAAAYAYAPGEVQVGSATGGTATVAVVQPDGVNDVDTQGAVVVVWDVVLPADSVGSVRLVADADGDGVDGLAIAGGLSAAPDGPRRFVWTPEGLSGSYSVCAILTWTRGEEIACSPPVNVAAPPTCACTATNEGAHPRLLAGLALAMLCAALGRRRT